MQQGRFIAIRGVLQTRASGSILHSDTAPYSAQKRFYGPSFQRTTLSASKQHWQTVTWRWGALPFIRFTCEHYSTTTIFLAVYRAEMKVWQHWYLLPPELRLLFHRWGQGSPNYGQTLVTWNVASFWETFVIHSGNSMTHRQKKRRKLK
jgi:hypothetical protein